MFGKISHRDIFPNVKSTLVIYGHTKPSVNTFRHSMFKRKQN